MYVLKGEVGMYVLKGEVGMYVLKAYRKSKM
jgi:hypothetical protein